MQSDPAAKEAKRRAVRAAVSSLVRSRATRIPLSLILAQLAARAAEHVLTLQSVVVALHGRSYLVLVTLIAMPFCIPIPTIALSTPLGLGIAFIGFRLMISDRVFLPRRLRRWEVPARFFPALLKAAGKLLSWLEKLIRPRWVGLVEIWFIRRLAGVAIAISGLLLMLPLPIPFSNCIPAFTVIILALSLAEEDGLGLIVGAILFVVTLFFFAALGKGTAEIINHLRVWWAS